MSFIDIFTQGAKGFVLRIVRGLIVVEISWLRFVPRLLQRLLVNSKCFPDTIEERIPGEVDCVFKWGSHISRVSEDVYFLGDDLDGEWFACLVGKLQSMLYEFFRVKEKAYCVPFINISTTLLNESTKHYLNRVSSMGDP